MPIPENLEIPAWFAQRRPMRPRPYARA